MKPGISYYRGIWGIWYWSRNLLLAIYTGSCFNMSALVYKVYNL